MKNIQPIKKVLYKQKRIGYISNKRHIKRNPSVERHTSVNLFSASTTTTNTLDKLCTAPIKQIIYPKAKKCSLFKLMQLYPLSDQLCLVILTLCGWTE